MEGIADDVVQMEGFLYKKSPSLFKGFQKRYFKIQDRDTKLVYYKNKPLLQEQPKGLLEIEEIESIEILDQKKNTFGINYHGRVFELKANSQQSAQKWIHQLRLRKQMLIDRNSFEKEQQQEQQQQPQQKSGAKAVKQFLGSIESIWQSRKIDENILNNIQTENEYNLLKDSDLEAKMKEQNDEMLKKFGLWEYLQKIDNEVLNKRMMMGRLVKKGSKNKFSFKQRWFFLISSRTLFDENDMEGLIHQSQLPIWLSLDCLYYFSLSSEKHDSSFKGNIALHKFKSLEINSLSKSSQESVNLSNIMNEFVKIFGNEKRMDYYGFKLSMKNRIYVFYTDFVTELNKWVMAIANCAQKIKKGYKSEDDLEEQNDKFDENVMENNPIQYSTKNSIFQKSYDNNYTNLSNIINKNNSNSNNINNNNSNNNNMKRQSMMDMVNMKQQKQRTFTDGGDIVQSYNTQQEDSKQSNNHLNRRKSKIQKKKRSSRQLQKQQTIQNEGYVRLKE